MLLCFTSAHQIQSNVDAEIHEFPQALRSKQNTLSFLQLF